MIKKQRDFKSATLAESLFLMCETSYIHGSPWKRQQFLADLENQNSNYLILEEAEEIVGFVSFQQVLDEVEILHLVVANASKGQGIGQRLLTALFNYSEGNQQEKIFLEVRQSNQSALNLYRKNGFEQVARRKNYYHAPVEDAWIMVKEVRSTKEP